MKPRLAVGEVELTHQGISVRHLDRLVGELPACGVGNAASPDPWL
jgi:hypothetical protein